MAILLPGARTVYQSGAQQGGVYTNTGLIVLVGYNENAAAICTLRRPFASSGYQVTSGKNFRILSIRFQSTSTSTQGPDYFGYADNDCGFGTSTARTNPVYLWTSNSVGLLQMWSTKVSANGGYEIGFPDSATGVIVPASKYMFCGDSQAGIHHMIFVGREV